MKNAINWFEIPARDFQRAVAFYSAILGEAVVVHNFGGEPHGMFPCDEDGVTGAIVAGDGYTPSVDGTTVYLNVEDRLDGVIGRVTGAGGQILLPKTDIGPHGFIAIIGDSEGNKVGLHSITG